MTAMQRRPIAPQYTEPDASDFDTARVGETTQRIRALRAAGTPDDLAAAAALRNAMVVVNLGLVHVIARRYSGAMDYEDRVMYGVLGLIRAVDDFDPEVGERFSVYARIWIRNQIGRALSDLSRMVRLPAYVVEGYQALARAMARDDVDAHDVSALAAATGFKAAKVVALLGSYNERVVPIDGNASDADIEHHEVHVAVSPLPSPAQLVTQVERRAAVLAAVDRLTPREAFVVLRRFGFVDDRAEHGLPENDGVWQLAEVAAALGVKVYMVRKIQSDAMRKLARRLRHLEYGGEPEPDSRDEQ